MFIRLEFVLAAASICGLFAQGTSGRTTFESFEVATIKPTPPNWRGGRYIRMTSPRRFVATNFTPRVLIASAYGLNPRAVLGGPSWIDNDHYDIVAGTSGSGKPSLAQQMQMLKELIHSRFGLRFHNEDRQYSVYLLGLAKGGPKLKESMAAADEDPLLVNRIFPDHVELPARNSTMKQFASIMQRSIFDRPVVDQTGLTGRYDFDLVWTPDESQFDGKVSPSAEATKPPLFAAIQQQLGLRLEAGRAKIPALVIDAIERPSEN